MPRFNICLVEPENATVFTEIADILYYALQDLSYHVTVQRFTVDVQAINIILGAHLISPESYANFPAHTIILNTEQLASLEHHEDENKREWHQRVMQLATRCQLWDYSPNNLRHFAEHGITHGQYLRLGYHAKMHNIPTAAERDIDVLFYGSINERRLHIIQQLQQHDLRVHTLFGV